MSNGKIKVASDLVSESGSEKLRLIRLKGHKARQMSHYGAHQADLRYCYELLMLLPGKPSDLSSDAIWKTAIITYVKCFCGNKARSTKLQEDVIFKGNEDALHVFKYFKNLRNKHLAHDENDYTTCIPSASINYGGKPYKVENIGFIGTTALTLDQTTYNNLLKLVIDTNQWVQEKYNTITKELNDELEGMPLEKLLAHEEVGLSMPDLDRIGLTRESEA
ncbi:hypothetical protein MKK63_07830 [Methylobacterium sp. J-088]|uniref:hypothetical protein n=1 Tax=Methylobacterium sp. J-088 TaxID=2836664 RepID=UPI001FBBEFA9|nr:hypothetical protein [Methylobacterium sp. J-088]MCJ2062614.1 hypothetical protein [Methylobacterium sp. J-088]